MKTYRTIFPLLFAFCATAFLASCSEPADPRTMPITATSPGEFDAWKKAATQKIPADEMKEFDSCVHEIGKGIMQRREATGVDPIAWKLCEYINGKTMREVIVMGYKTTVDWVTRELALQRTNIAKTEAALNGPGSDSKKREHRDFLVMAKDNVAKLEARRDKAKARLAELEAKP